MSLKYRTQGANLPTHIGDPTPADKFSLVLSRAELRETNNVFYDL